MQSQRQALIHFGLDLATRSTLIACAVVMVGVFARLTWIEVRLDRYRISGMTPPVQLQASERRTIVTFVAVVGVGIATSGVLLVRHRAYRRGRWKRKLGSNTNCYNCGYSRAGLSEARCPECGTVLTGW